MSDERGLEAATRRVVRADRKRVFGGSGAGRSSRDPLLALAYSLAFSTIAC